MNRSLPPPHSCRSQLPVPKAGRRLATWGLSALLLACTPTYNWRELRVDPGLTVWLPCKPETRSRTAPLAGADVPMRLVSCEANGAVWGVLVADIGKHSHVEKALSELNTALASNIGGVPTLLGPVGLPGQPAAGHALRMRADGQRPDGSRVQVEAWVFADGHHVYQASLLQTKVGTAGSNGDTIRHREARDTFFSSLKLNRA